jgi:hypothetical protein
MVRPGRLSDPLPSNEIDCPQPAGFGAAVKIAFSGWETAIVTVATLLSTVPSFAVHVNVSIPENPAFGV